MHGSFFVGRNFIYKLEFISLLAIVERIYRVVCLNPLPGCCVPNIPHDIRIYSSAEDLELLTRGRRRSPTATHFIQFARAALGALRLLLIQGIFLNPTRPPPPPFTEPSRPLTAVLWSSSARCPLSSSWSVLVGFHHMHTRAQIRSERPSSLWMVILYEKKTRPRLTFCIIYLL